jgi:hypothetical protein
MPKKLRLALLIFGGLLASGVAAILVVYWLSQRAPRFYREALAADPAVQRQAAERMDRQVMALASNVKTSGQWQMKFTAEEINGWLAVVLPQKFPEAMPRWLHDPRVAIEPGGITLACRYEQGGFQSVLSLTIEPYAPQPEVLALRIRQPRAGLVPIPLNDLVANVAKAVKESGCEVRRRQAGGDPVLQITLGSARAAQGNRVRIETLELRQGELYIEGTTTK